MDNLVAVNKIDSLVEEKVELLINNQKVVAFNASPQELEIGEEYKAEIDIFTNDFLEITEQKNEQIKRIEHLNNFSYMLWGELLEDNVLDVGFFITMTYWKTMNI
ncbi:hypothetical protein O174_03145 [Listeria monocytogenes serotype 4bV str. LS644]|nr:MULTISPECIES: hypothetical protein [Listeria]ERH79420.1 hypothetical protein O174_03145 [Listeria monocytogenes serotype 4bV str. LS644]ERH81841.1 hypothetical protein O171_10720 [Listeria monocytogenes serotype 4bV str. LS645]ERH85660.1 hypothetical protein O168_03210 [Listeria monocytogenes serotype 4bV str. LS643]